MNTELKRIMKRININHAMHMFSNVADNTEYLRGFVFCLHLNEIITLEEYRELLKKFNLE